LKDYDDFNPDSLNFAEKDQDRVINQLVFDSDFLSKCKRRGLEAELFTSELRRAVVDYIFEFYDKYKEAPADQIIEILSGGIGGNGNKSGVKDDDLEAMQDYLSLVVGIENSVGRIKRLYDRLSEFIEKRILHTTISRLSKAKDRIDGSPEMLKKIVSEAAERLSSQTTTDSTLGIFDEVEIDQEPWLTRFNIPEIDQSYGGGLSSPNLVILQAFTGRGKTWSICHLAKIGLRMGNDVVALVTEMNAKKFLSRMRQTLTGMTPWEMRDDIERARDVLKRSLVGGSLFNLISDQVKLDKDFSIDALEGIVEEIEERRGRPQKIILIDSPDDMEPPSSWNVNSSKPIEKSKAIWTWLRNYSQENEKLIVATSQSQRKAEGLLWTTSGNIGDDLNKVRRATLGISINGYKSEIEAGFIRLLVFKNTYGPDMKAAWVETDFSRGMFEKNSGEIKGLNMERYKNMLLQRGVSLSNRQSSLGS
jgi:archaellum biogenesis ATPase FlaH